VICSTISEVGSPASTCVTQEQTVGSPNEPYQSFPETSLQFPDRLELPIGRIRPLHEALDAIVQASRKMIVPRPLDAQLSRVYKHLMRVTVYPSRRWSTGVYGSYSNHLDDILSAWGIRTHARYNRLASDYTHPPEFNEIELQMTTTCVVSQALGHRRTWTLEFTVLIVFERNNCVLYFFLLDEPVAIENCRYRFVYGTE
jgi:hypothetical protein